jgi:hypothetical protein
MEIATRAAREKKITHIKMNKRSSRASSSMNINGGARFLPLSWIYIFWILHESPQTGARENAIGVMQMLQSKPLIRAIIECDNLFLWIQNGDFIIFFFFIIAIRFLFAFAAPAACLLYARNSMLWYAEEAKLDWLRGEIERHFK